MITIKIDVDKFRADFASALAGSRAEMKEVSDTSDRVIEFDHAFTAVIFVATRDNTLFKPIASQPDIGSVESQGALWFWLEGC